MRDLPLDTEKALEAVAEGWTRTPTHAHPDCTCLIHQTHIEWVAPLVIHGHEYFGWRPRPLRRQPKHECPIHPRRR